MPKKIPRNDSLDKLGDAEIPLSRNSSFKERSSILQNLGQLTENENMEMGRVSFQVYKNYVKSIGPLLCLCILFFNCLYQIFGVASSFWLSKWSTDSSAEEASVRNRYLEVYGLLGLGQGRLFNPLSKFELIQYF